MEEGGLSAKEMLQINHNNTTIGTRSQNQNLFEKSINRKEFHHEKLSVLRRHKNLVLDILGKEGYKDILIQSHKVQKKHIGEYMGNMKTKENEILKHISHGSLKDKVTMIRERLGY